MKRIAALLLALWLAACGGGSQAPGGAGVLPKAWPASGPGEDPPPAPPVVEALMGRLDLLPALLPPAVATTLFDPLITGVTVRDLTDPALVAFTVRATLAQLLGPKPAEIFHWYGHPDYNHSVAQVPVHFQNRHGTSLYGEIVLPRRGQVPPSDGPFPAILVLEGQNTNLAMYRWWHQLYADAGYLVFAFDFSGQGHSEDEAEGDPGDNVHDAQDALDYLLERSPVAGAVDRRRIGVVGHSMGAIASLGLQAVEPRIHAAVAAAPISESSAPFDANPVPVMIQTGDHDGPVAPIPAVNPAVVRPVYDKLQGDRAFIVADASTHAQHTNYALLPTASWGLELAGRYSLAWMDWHLRRDPAALEILRSPHPHLSWLWDSEVRIGPDSVVMRGAGPLP